MAISTPPASAPARIERRGLGFLLAGGKASCFAVAADAAMTEGERNEPCGDGANCRRRPGQHGVVVGNERGDVVLCERARRESLSLVCGGCTESGQYCITSRSDCRRFATRKSVPGADGGASLPVTATHTCMLFQKHCTRDCTGATQGQQHQQQARHITAQRTIYSVQGRIQYCHG